METTRQQAEGAMENLYRCLFTTKSFRRRRRRRRTTTGFLMLGLCHVLLLLLLMGGGGGVAGMEDNLASFDSNFGEWADKGE